MIKEKQKEAFDMLAVGFELGEDSVMLMECTLKKDIKAGEKVAVICLGSPDDDGKIAIVPVAVMLDKLYEFLAPPSAIKTGRKKGRKKGVMKFKIGQKVRLAPFPETDTPEEF